MPHVGSTRLLICGALQNGRDGIGDYLVGFALEQGLAPLQEETGWREFADVMCV